MGSLWSIVGTLISGGKFLGLTLGQLEAIASVLQSEEPAVQKLISDATPLVQKAMAALAANVGKPPSTIPGYQHDGSVGPIHNPDAR